MELLIPGRVVGLGELNWALGKNIYGDEGGGVVKWVEQRRLGSSGGRVDDGRSRSGGWWDNKCCHGWILRHLIPHREIIYDRLL